MAGELLDFDLEKTRRSDDPRYNPTEPKFTITDSTGVTIQSELNKIFQVTETLISVANEVSEAQNTSIGTFKINMLPTKVLKSPLDAILERDGDGFLARTVELPLYGCGEDPVDAIEMLKSEVESLYIDLKEDDNFTGDWLRIKKFLTSIIAD